MNQSVIVIGGGLVGSAAALRLQFAGARVLLVDPGREQDRASFGNATLIANHLVEPLASWAVLAAAPGKLFGLGGPLDFVWRDVATWAPFALRYLAACTPARFDAGKAALEGLMHEALPAWRRLAADAGRPELVADQPVWSVWESAERMAADVAAIRAGGTGPVTVRDLAAQEIAAVAREMSPAFRGGVAFEGTAKLTDPGEAVRALHAALARAGGTVISGEAARIAETGRAEVRLADGRLLEADLAVIAAGARSGRLARQAGLAAPLVAERGYHIQYADHDAPDGFPALICDERWICVTRAGTGLRITGFTEVGGPNSPPDARKWRALERHAADLKLPVRGEPSRWMGARPTLPDFLPAIGRKGRMLYAFGHQHVGVTLAAATAEAVVELAAGDRVERLEPFDLARFS